MNKLGWSESKCIVLLLPLVVSISFAMDVFVPAIPSMQIYFHTSNQVLQSSLYVFMVTVALGQLVIGPLSDRYGRRYIALISAVCLFTGCFFSSITESIYFLIVTRILQAIGACGTYLTCFIIIRDNYNTQACARLFSLLCGLNAFIASTAPVIGGILLDLTHNWRSEFIFLSLLAIVILLVILKAVPNYDPQVRSATFRKQIRVYLSITRSRHFQLYALGASCGLVGLYLFCALSPDILIQQLNNTPTQYGFWFGANAITIFIANSIAVKLTRVIRLENLILIGICFIIFFCLVMLFVNHRFTSSVTFMLPMLGITTGIGLSMGCATALSLKHFQDVAGSATAMVSAYQFGFAGLIGILVAQFPPSPFTLALPVLLMTLLFSSYLLYTLRFSYDNHSSS